MNMQRKFFAGLALSVVLSSPSSAQALDVGTLPEFLPVPAAVKARMLPVDQQKGYLVKELRPNVYMITDGAYQSLFVATGSGVILLDAPASFGSNIVQAVAEVTKEPIKEIVYSHSHLDHISGAAAVMKQVPDLKENPPYDCEAFILSQALRHFR
jgi:glyoxylase-like metal-dependent hydrolase (beta-lactamase superfamily II)